MTEGLAIQLLGEFRVSVGARAIDEREWTSRGARHLVKLLALAPHHRLHRELVIDRLWPGMGPEDGANNLHKALYMARRILEPDLPPRRASSYLQLRRDLLLPEAPGGLWIDAEAFLAAAHAAHERRTLQAYQEVLCLHTGDLVLEEHHEDWAIAHRDWLSGLRVTLLIELAGAVGQRADAPDLGHGFVRRPVQAAQHPQAARCTHRRHEIGAGVGARHARLDDGIGDAKDIASAGVDHRIVQAFGFHTPASYPRVPTWSGQLGRLCLEVGDDSWPLSCG